MRTLAFCGHEYVEHNHEETACNSFDIFIFVPARCTSEVKRNLPSMREDESIENESVCIYTFIGFT